MRGVIDEHCWECYWHYQEKENNWRECKHPDIEEDICPGWLARADVVGRQYDHDQVDWQKEEEE